MAALTLAAKSRTLSILSLRVGSLNLSSSAAIASVTLPFIGKRGKRAHTEEAPIRVYSEHFPYEEKQIAYNRMHGLPDDAI